MVTLLHVVKTKATKNKEIAIARGSIEHEVTPSSYSCTILTCPQVSLQEMYLLQQTSLYCTSFPDLAWRNSCGHSC